MFYLYKWIVSVTVRRKSRRTIKYGSDCSRLPSGNRESKTDHSKTRSVDLEKQECYDQCFARIDEPWRRSDSNATIFPGDRALTMPWSMFADVDVFRIASEPLMYFAPACIPTKICKEIIRISKGHVKPSRVWGGRSCEQRTSWSAFVTQEWALHPAVLQLEAYMKKLLIIVSYLSGRCMPRLIEATQIVRYTRGQWYAPHMDNPKSWQDVLPRPITMLIYLNSLHLRDGGHTRFPKARLPAERGHQHRLKNNGIFWDENGLSVVPQQGSALIFFSERKDGQECPCSLHCGEPLRGILKEKWIATRWAEFSFQEE